MKYLRIEEGAFASKIIEKKDLPSSTIKCAPLGVRFVHLGDFADALERFAVAGFPQDRRRAPRHVVAAIVLGRAQSTGPLRAHAKSNPHNKASGSG
mgnify:CR=1 FL=1